MDTAQQQQLLPVPHVVIAVVIAAVATFMIVTLLTHHQALAVVEVMEAVADPAAARSHAGQNQGLPFPTQRPKYNHSHQFDKRLRNLPLSNLICVMSSFAMPGMTDKVLPKSCTLMSSQSHVIFRKKQHQMPEAGCTGYPRRQLRAD
ncbi:hypothetical protein NG99_07020 [Erwinia typographi]|uniref:Uncharacterized protein n=1 Tax=Erwinia typographi TaxID=371042 RepID=A0A0A3ZAT0_9GAMM|nr:hypothetical protein NG99_07020 [Erwinia typographi]